MNLISIRKILCLVYFFLPGGTVAAADDSIEIMHQAVSPVSVGGQVDISATVDDPHNDLEMVRVYFKTTQDDRFYFVAMEKTRSNTYTGVLPAPLRGSDSLEYVIIAKSTSDQIVKTRHYVVKVEDEDTIARLD